MNKIIISIKEIQTNKNIFLKDLELDDLFDDLDDYSDDDLIFDIEHYNKENVRLLECKNCILGADLYLLIFNEKMTMFTVTDTSNIIINENKIKLFGWDAYVNISLKKGKIKEINTR